MRTNVSILAAAAIGLLTLGSFTTMGSAGDGPRDGAITVVNQDGAGGGGGDQGGGGAGEGRRGRGGPGRDGGGPGEGGPGGPGARGGPGQRGGPQPGQVLPGPVQEMLNLTPEQRQQVAALQKEVDEKLSKILTEEQMKQLKERRRPGPGGPSGGPEGRGAPGGGGRGPGGGGRPGGPPPQQPQGL